jgi:GcrA cell cycle regulator
MPLAITGWTDERVTELRRLWDNGDSASQIAATLGRTTRCAVLGKVHRLNLDSRKPSEEARRFGLAPEKRGARRTFVKSAPKSITLFAADGSMTTLRRDPSAGKVPAGTSKTSAAYRSCKFGLVQEMTKSQLREMLAQAVRNTAAATA